MANNSNVSKYVFPEEEINSDSLMPQDSNEVVRRILKGRRIVPDEYAQGEENIEGSRDGFVSKSEYNDIVSVVKDAFDGNPDALEHVRNLLAQ